MVGGSEDAAEAAATVVPFEDRSEASAGCNTKEEQKVARAVVDLVEEDTECDLVVRDKCCADVCSLAVTLETLRSALVWNSVAAMAVALELEGMRTFGVVAHYYQELVGRQNFEVGMFLCCCLAVLG